MPRHQDPEATVAALLNAAVEVVADHGLRGATTDLIAKRAGVGAGTVFRHFPSKEQLLVEAYRYVKAEAAEIVFARLDLTGQPLRERLRLVWKATANAMLDHKQGFLFVEQCEAASLGSTLVEEVPFAKLMKRMLQEAWQEQVLRPLAPEVFDALFFGPARELARHKHLRGVAVGEAQLEQAWEGCWNAVRR